MMAEPRLMQNAQPPLLSLVTPDALSSILPVLEPVSIGL